VGTHGPAVAAAFKLKPDGEPPRETREDGDGGDGGGDGDDEEEDEAYFAGEGGR